MKCRKIKKFITLDYIDGEIKEELKKKIKRHLKECASCREYEKILRKQVTSPLRKAKELYPPEELWGKIRERIESEETANDFLKWADKLRDAFPLQRPAVAAVVAAALILIAAVFTKVTLNGRSDLNAYLDDQVDYLFSMDIGESNGDISFGTDIEEYFM